MQSARRSAEYLETCIIACEGSKNLDQSINPIDYWTFMISNVYETRLPEGCRKVVIRDDDLSLDRIGHGIAHLDRSISKDYGFDSLSHPHHSAIHVSGVTDVRERIRAVLATKSARAPVAKVAIINEDSACFYLSTDWPDILPTLRTHYDQIIAVSIGREGEHSDFHDPEFDTYWRKRREEIARFRDAIVEIPVSDISGNEHDNEHAFERITDLTCEIANVLVRKTPAEISALPTCDVIPFRDWMRLVAWSEQAKRY